VGKKKLPISSEQIYKSPKEVGIFLFDLDKLPRQIHISRPIYVFLPKRYMDFSSIYASEAAI